MDEIVLLVRTNQIKKRLAGVTALLDALKTQRDPVTTNVDFLTSLLPDIAPCLRENNFKVAMTSLEILELLLASVADTAVRAQFKVIWNGLMECLGDSKLQVRGKAVDVIVMLAQILGVSVMFDRLRPCIAHKNWRTREQTVHALWRCLEQLRLFNSTVKNEVLDDTVRLLEDSAKEVRDSAMRALEKFYEHLGPALMYELENKKIRAAHMKALTEKFSGGATQTQLEPTYLVRSSFADPPRSVDAAPLSSAARFLSAIRNKEIDFNNINSINSDVEAFSRPPQTSVVPVDKSPSQSSTASQSASVADATADTATGSRPSGGISDKDIQRELGKIADGLRLDNDWSVRVESLKNLQRLAHKCNHTDVGATSALAQGIRPLREVLSEQVVDLRSSVAREACQTLQTLAKVLKDDFNPHAEYFMNNLMKATYVTILVISTASDTSIRGIIESTKNGYNRLIAKFIDGAKTRNQVLRLNCVTYLTLTLERWNVLFLNKHLDLFIQILPTLLHDAVSDVRAQARKCFWALHRLFPQEADALLERLDPSTQKNVRDDAAAREKRNSADQATTSGTSSIFASSGRFKLRKDNSASRLLGDVNTEFGSSSSSMPTSENASSSVFSGGAAKIPASLTSSSAASVGPRRVLGATPLGETTDPSRSLPSRVLGQGGAMRVGLPARIQSFEDDSSAQGAGKPLAGPLRVLKAVDRPDTTGGQSMPPAPRAQRVQIATETSPSAGNSGDSGQTTSGPVVRKDRANGPKRRAVTPEAQSSGAEEQPSDNSVRPLVDADSQAPRSSSSRDQNNAPKTSRPTSTVVPATVEEGFDEALARIENGLWSVRLEAVELIDRRLEKSGPVPSESAKERKMDERVLLALIRHLTDAHYRVAQAALKALQSCLRIVSQQQVAPFLKTILPRLFQKFVDPKESTRVVAREILEFLVSKYDATLLIGYVIQQLADGSNMKMKAAVCHYVKELLPGSRDYIQQSPNNAHMRGLLTKIAQLLEGDAPVAVAASCANIVQIACTLYPSEVENSMPLLAPSKRSTLSRVLREKGIVLSLSQGGAANNTPVPQSSNATSMLDNQIPPPPPAEVVDKAPTSRKRHAQSPSKFATSPLITSRKDPDVAVVTPVSDKGNAAKQDRAPVLDYDRLSSLSDFASMLSSASMKSPEEQFDDLLLTVGDNNASESEKAAAYHKMGGFIKTEPDPFWETYFPRVLSVLLEAASERDANAVRVLQRFVRAQPHRAEEFFHPILIGLLDSINGCVDLAAHLAELTLTDIVRASTKTDRVLDLLMPLVESRDPPALQVVLQLVRAVLERAAEQGPSSKSSVLLRSTEWNMRLLALLVAKLQHPSSDVRKRAVDCLVAYYFATNEDAQLSSYLAQHVDVTKQKLVDIFIQRKKADRERASMMDVSA